MAIVPFELNGVLSHAFGRNRHYRGLEHRQFARLGLNFGSHLASALGAFIVAHGAWTGVSQEGKSVVRKMTVFPLDVHTGSFGQVDFHGFWIGMSHSGRTV